MKENSYGAGRKRDPLGRPSNKPAYIQCSVQGCERLATARGLCCEDYKIWWDAKNKKNKPVIIKQLEWKQTQILEEEAKGLNCIYYVDYSLGIINAKVIKSVFGTGYNEPENGIEDARKWCQEDFEKDISKFLEPEDTNLKMVHSKKSVHKYK